MARLLERSRVRWFDCNEVTQHLRTQLKLLQKELELEQMVEGTTNAYMSVIEQQKEQLQKGLHFYRQRQQDMEKYFERFCGEVHSEIDACVSYVNWVKQERADGKDIERWPEEVLTWQKTIEKVKRSKGQGGGVALARVLA